MELQERASYLELILGKLQWHVELELLLEYHETKKQLDQFWTIEKTAEILGRSFPNVNKDFRIARSLRRFPQLKNCRTKMEADSVADQLNAAAKTSPRGRPLQS